ncbi:MAG: hypothetical protein WBA18_01005 [Terracidiphilus sp.]
MEVASEGIKKRRKHWWVLWIGAALGLILVALGVAVAIMMRRAEPMLRAVIVEKLEDRFHARVELDSFHISLVKGLWAEGKGLRIWPPAEVEGMTVPGENATAAANLASPLIQLDEFRFHAPLHYDPGKPIRISVVQLNGLWIDIPPKTHFTHAAPTAGAGNSPAKKSLGTALLHFVVNTIECKDAHLTLETSKPGKLPLAFDIAELKLTDVSAEGPMRFDAQLTNPRPAGAIQTSGTVGPWDVEDPGETPIAGDYVFHHADLGVFKGIAGIMESKGQFNGALRDMNVDGTTDTPDFRLTNFGTALPLHTTFHAIVDGTNGDTWLRPVNAVLGRSSFTVEGEVIRSQAVTSANGQEVRPAGRDILLNVNIAHGRMEDFMRLTSKSGTPLLTGDLTLKTLLEIPPGKEPVHERMKLSNGTFALTDAEFSSEKIESYVGQLSLRGLGDAKEVKKDPGSDVASSMQSDFSMTGGVINLPDLKYTVPGAEIDLAGKYGIEGSILNFTGTAKMQATVSQMVGGWKGLLLKPADRLFKKDGAGTEVPIHVDGTREDPKFGVDFDRMKHTHPATPGQSQ